MPAVVLSRIVVISRSSCSLRCWLRCCSVTSSVTTDVVRLPEASVAGSTRVSSQRWPSSGWLDRVAHLGALGAAQRLLQPLVFGQRVRRDDVAADALQRADVGDVVAGSARRRRAALAHPARRLLEGREADAGGVHHRADLHLREIALLLDAAVLDHRHVATLAAGALVAAHDRAQSLQRRRRAARPSPAHSSGREPGCSCSSGAPPPQPSSSLQARRSPSVSETGTLPTSASKAGLVRTSRPLSSNSTMPTGLRSNQSSSSRTERSARSRATCSAVVSCSTAR